MNMLVSENRNVEFKFVGFLATLDRNVTDFGEIRSAIREIMMVDDFYAFRDFVVKADVYERNQAQHRGFLEFFGYEPPEIDVEVPYWVGLESSNHWGIKLAADELGLDSERASDMINNARHELATPVVFACCWQRVDEEPAFRYDFVDWV